MLNESREGPSLVPTEKVAMPKNEAEDKATRKMIAQVQKTLSPRFPLEIGSLALEFQDSRYVPLRQLGKEKGIRAGLRVSQKEYQLKPNQDVEIVSGMCFFGASGLRGRDAHGTEISLVDPVALRQEVDFQVEEILESETLHISEASSILRTTGAIDLLTNSQIQAGQRGKIRCNFHLPVPEYKLYMLRLFQLKRINTEQFEDLTLRIDRRAASLAQMISSRIPSSVELSFFSPLQELEPLLQRKKHLTTLEDCLPSLRANPVTRSLLEQLNPQSCEELPHISYVAGYLQKAQEAEQKARGCLAVEVAEESPILSNASRLAKQQGSQLNMAALFVLTDVITERGRHGKKALFMHDPEDGASPLQELKFVVKNSKGGQCLR